MKQLTALEYFFDHIDKKFMVGESTVEVYEEALKLEKEQIEEAFSIGQENQDSYHYVGKRIHSTPEEYYNKCYGEQ